MTYKAGRNDRFPKGLSFEGRHIPACFFSCKFMQVCYNRNVFVYKFIIGHACKRKCCHVWMWCITACFKEKKEKG